MNCECVLCKNNKPFVMPDEIINAAQKGELVLFCGAGISTESKVVLPQSFYAEIKSELNITDNSLPFSELMQKYCDMPNGRRKLLIKIKERFEYINSFSELECIATRFHQELSELYFIKTIITTNWDTYFEEYCAATPITIPQDYVFWDENERCVLKIHGSINNLSTIVATKDDYIKCTENLEKGIIGSTLKTILAKNTVVYIGFSFGDEDFAQILEYLRTEMKDIMPHIYIVTIDNQLSAKLDNNNSTCILTDGTYFLHQLKSILQEKKLLVNCGTKPIVENAKNTIKILHTKVLNIDFRDYPCVIYCLAYQDGIIHAFERFSKLYNKGVYNNPQQISDSIRMYEEIVQDYSETENYWDEAYYEGYLNGLVFIALCQENQNIIKEFPMLYLPKHDINSYDVFLEKLKSVTKRTDVYHKYALSLTEKYKESDIGVHHPPF